MSKFKGAFTAMITPMHSDGSIDEGALRQFVAWQIKEGIHGLVPVGTTGESPTLSHDEHKRVVDLTVETAEGQVPVIAGCGSNSTAEAIDLTYFAKESGADAAMLVTPYYNKPTQDGLYAHYAAIADAVDIPIIIYNIPGRSVVDLSVETMAKLVEDYPSIIGVKDATAKLERCLETRLTIGDDFIQFSGEDPTAAAFLAQGGHGIISVTSNLAPKLNADLQTAWLAGDLDQFAALRDQLFPITKAVFAFQAPTATVKTALAIMDKASEQVRLPLVPLTTDEQRILSANLKTSKLI